MGVIWKIAFRNLKEHRTKTLIIGIIITVGITVLVVGNSLMDTAAEGIRRTYTASYTADFMVTGLHQGSLTLFGLQDMDSIDAVVPVIDEYEKVYEFAVAHPDVVAVNPQATATSMIDLDETRSFLYLFGIDPAAYQAMFPDNVEILSGRFLQPGEEGIVLSEQTARELTRNREHPLQPGETVVLTGMNEISGIKVREVPVRGIFRFRYTNPQLDAVSLIDISNVRALAGMNLYQVSVADLTETEAALFGEFDEDALFGGGFDSLFGGDLIQEAEFAADTLDESTLLNIFGESDEDQLVVENSNAWHFLLIQVRPGASTAQVMADFEAFFAQENIAAQTANWLQGAGALANLAYGVKGLFNVVIFVIAVVGIIIIMNTLVISVTERTTEIGTMRALGAQKSFVRRMIAWETIMASGIFGILGVIVGCLVLWILNIVGIEAPNVFFEILFGGKVLHPVPSVGSIITSLILVLVIGLVASLYPVSIALKTKPVKAMQG